MVLSLFSQLILRTFRPGTVNTSVLQVQTLKYREVLYQAKCTSLRGLSPGSLTAEPRLLIFAPFCPVPTCPVSARAAVLRHFSHTSLAYLNAISSLNPVESPTALSFCSTQQFCLCFMVLFIVTYCPYWWDPLFLSAAPCFAQLRL